MIIQILGMNQSHHMKFGYRPGCDQTTINTDVTVTITHSSIPNKNHAIKRVKFGRDIVIGFIKDESLYKTLYTEYRHFHFSVENQKKTLICPSHKVTWQPDKRLNSFTVTRTRRRAGLSYIVKTLKEWFTQITKKTKHIFSHLTSEVCGLSRAEVFKP